MIKITVKDFDFQKRVEKLKDLPKELAAEGYKFFKKATPVRTGNARRKTRQNSNKITADYPYAGKLNDGYSKQAPKGMSQPTIDHLKKFVKKQIKKK